jgi:glycosyltransferase involved in cell wall biosynthesis
LQQCLRRANALACVSRITQERLHRYAPRFTAKSALIYNCVEPASGEGGRAPIAELEDHPFLFCVAQHRRNKNIPLLIRTFARLLISRQIDRASRLLIVGVEGPETNHIRRQIHRASLSHRVHLMDGLSEAELQWCYTHCELLVAPSTTEGFGLPVAEALLAGCRVVCSEIPAFREVGDGHCHFVDLQSQAEGALTSAIVSAMEEPRGAPMPLRQFSAPVIAGEYLKLYRDLLAATSSSHQITNPVSNHGALNTVPERRG